MQFKIGQQFITIMNMFNIFVQHTIIIYFIFIYISHIQHQSHYVLLCGTFHVLLCGTFLKHPKPVNESVKQWGLVHCKKYIYILIP